MFYVYEWYIKNTNEIIYVGKGSKKRYLTKKHNRLFNEMIKRFDCKSRIVKTFELEEEAFDFEYQRINELKNIGQCICNIAKGGYGGHTNWWTKEMRNHYSQKNCMKNQIQRERMKKNNPMKNERIAKEVGEKHRKPFFIGNKQYNTLEEASKDYQVTISCIKYWLSVGHNKDKLCYYANEQPIDYDFSQNIHITNHIKIKYNNRIYNSLKELAKDINMKYTTLHKKIKNKQIEIEYL